MAQIVDIPYNPTSSAEPLSQSINRHFQNLFPAGPYSGLYQQAGSSTKVTITAGYAITAEGCRVMETADKIDELSITPNESAWPRWDAIVLRHLYQTVYPMPDAYYDIVQGTPATHPEYPASLPDDATLLGHAYLPAGDTDYTVYVPAPRPHDNWRTVTCSGLGAAQPGDYNGDQGLLDALAALKDTGGIILLSGIFMADNPLDIPAGVEIIGVGWALIHGLDAGGTIRLLGRSGSSTLGNGNSNLADPLADFSLYGLKSLVYIEQTGGVGDVSGFYPIASKTGTMLTLIGGPFAEQPCNYCVLNTAKIRNVRISNGMDAHCVALQYTFMAQFEDCMLQTGGSACGFKGEDYTKTQHTTWRRCHFDCDGRAIDLYQDDQGLIEGCQGEGAIRVQEGAQLTRIVGNPGMTVEITDTNPTWQVGDPAFPFNEEHSPQGKHDYHQEFTFPRYGYLTQAALVATAAAGTNQVTVQFGRGELFTSGDFVWLRGTPTNSAEYNVVESVDGDVITLKENLQWTKEFDDVGDNFSIIAIVTNLEIPLDGRDRLITARGFIHPDDPHTTSLQPGQSDSGIHGHLRPEGDYAYGKDAIFACKYSVQGVHPVGSDAESALDNWLVLYDGGGSQQEQDTTPQGRIIVAQQDVTIDGVKQVSAGDVLLLGIGADDEDPQGLFNGMSYHLVIGLTVQTGEY